MNVTKAHGFLQEPKAKTLAIATTIACVVAFFIYIKDIASLQLLYVSSDEMGYLGTAAYLSGLDWSSMVSHLHYFSYGYSLLLAPLFSFTTNTAIVYQLAIALNALFMTLTIPVSYYVGRRIFPSANHWLVLACCVCIALYPANLLQVTMARNETLLYLLVWLALACFFALRDTRSIWPVVCMAAVTFYAFMVHQRAAALVIACAVVLFLMLIKRQLSIKQFIAFCVVTVLLYVTHVFIKDYIKSAVWGNAVTSTYNDFSRIPDKIAHMFTAEGFRSFSQVLLGQLFYLGAATCLLYYIGIYILVPRSFRLLRYKVFVRHSPAYSRVEWGLLFLCISIVLTMLISAVFLIRPMRTDHILYGRYNEIFVGPVLLLTLLTLFRRNSLNTTRTVVCIVIFVLLGIVAQYSIQGLPNFISISAPGMAWMEPWFYSNWFAVVVLAPLTLFTAVRILTLPGKRLALRVTVVLCLLSMYFVYAGNYSITNTILPAQEQNRDAVKEPLAYIQDNGVETVYGYAEGEDAWQFSYLQFVLPKQPIHMLDSAEDISTLPDGSTIVTTASGLFLPDLTLQSTIVASSGRYVVWEINRNGVQGGTLDSIPLSLFSTQVGEFSTDNSSVRSTGEAGYLLYGPYINVPAGDYEGIVHYALLQEAQGVIGTVDVMVGGTQIAVQELAVDHEQTPVYELAEQTISFHLEEPAEALELRVYLDGSSSIEIYDVFLATQ